MKKNILILLVVIILSFSLQSKEEKSEEDILSYEIEVVGKIAVNKTIQSVTVFEREDLQGYDMQGIKSVLNQAAGFLTLSSGHFGQMSYSFARGASVNQTLFLIDGFKMTDPSNSMGLNLSIVSPDLIEKVEIVRGPLSNIFGSNAMGGVVNLITREKEGLSASVFMGSHQTYESKVYASKKLGNLHFSIIGNKLKYSDGLVNDEFNNNGFTLKAHYKKMGLKAGLMFVGNFAESGIPINLSLITPNRNYRQNNFLIALPLTYTFNTDTTLSLKLSHNNNKYEFRDPDDVWVPYFMNQSYVNQIQLTLKTLLFNFLKLSSGLDYSDQKIINEDHLSTSLNNEKTNYFSAFMNMGANFKDLMLSTSFRFDKYKNIDSVISPQIGFSYLFANRFKIRGSFSQSFRAPILPELINPLWGNPELKPEEGKAFEIGGEFYSRDVTFSLVYFNSKYENLIGYSPVTFKFANLIKADISGIEFSTRFNLLEDIHLKASYTYLDTNDFQYNRELLRRPRHSFSSHFTYKNKFFRLSGEMIYVGKRLDYDELIWSVGKNPSFNTFSFNIYIPINKHLSITGKITNAFDKVYQEVLGYPSPSRRFLFGISYKII